MTLQCSRRIKSSEDNVIVSENGNRRKSRNGDIDDDIQIETLVSTFSGKMIARGSLTIVPFTIADILTSY